MAYVYVWGGKDLWTVGHYTPGGYWVAESDHGSSKDAAERVRYLHGGSGPAVHEMLEALKLWQATFYNKAMSEPERAAFIAGRDAIAKAEWRAS